MAVKKVEQGVEGVEAGVTQAGPEVEGDEVGQELMELQQQPSGEPAQHEQKVREKEAAAGRIEKVLQEARE